MLYLGTGQLIGVETGGGGPGGGQGGARGGLGPPPILGILYIKYAEFILNTPIGPPNPVYVPTLLGQLWGFFIVEATRVGVDLIIMWLVPPLMGYPTVNGISHG